MDLLIIEGECKRFVLNELQCCKALFIEIRFTYTGYFIEVLDIINKQYPPFVAKICWDICPRTLSVPSIVQFSESVPQF